MSLQTTIGALAAHYELIIISRVDNLIVTQSIFLLAFINALRLIETAQLVRYAYPITNMALCHLNMFYCFTASTLIARARIKYKYTCFLTLNWPRAVCLNAGFLVLWCFFSDACGAGRLWTLLLGNCLVAAVVIALSTGVGLVMGI